MDVNIVVIMSIQIEYKLDNNSNNHKNEQSELVRPRISQQP